MIELIGDWQATRRPEVVPPSFASAWGDDRYGLWANLSVKQHTQRMRWIEPGEFMMGAPAIEVGGDADEKPAHRVRISQGFWLADTACTQELWQAVMSDNPSYFQGKRNRLQTKGLPVEQVGHKLVGEFLNALALFIPKNFQAQLPTDAQWEYACRAGTKTSFSFGNDISKDQVNFNSNSPVAVSTLPPNKWGLFEMHGNVWEWCADAKRRYAELDELSVEVDPEGSKNGAYTLRGGSWGAPAQHARSAFRNQDRIGSGWRFDGFRFALRSI